MELKIITFLIRLVLWGTVIALPITFAIYIVEETDAHVTRDRHWHYKREASYYGSGFYGRRTACGATMHRYAWHVAALKPDLAKCGLRLQICRGTIHRRCVYVRMMDRGAWRSDRRDLDLTPRVKAALRCPDLCTVRWRKA